MALISGSCWCLGQMASCCCRVLLNSSCCGPLIKVCLSSFTDISPAELDALWREPSYTIGGTSEHFSEKDRTTGAGTDDDRPVVDGNGGVEADSYWKRKEAFFRGSTVSMGEKFSSEIVLLFTGQRRSSVDPDRDLQEALRTRLRVVESNSKDVIQLFKAFWLDPHLLSDLQISVRVDEEHLATLYLGLLLQEGSFFAKALVTRSEQDEEDEEQLSFKKNDLVMVRDTGQDDMWEGTMLSTGNHGLVPVHTMQPLPYPFYHTARTALCHRRESACPSLSRTRLEKWTSSRKTHLSSWRTTAGRGKSPSSATPTLTLLNRDHFQEDFLPLYDLQYSFLWVTFSGKTETELSGHLESVRECAKRMGMQWAHRRACFLLGRLCARKLKLSQARVYYEEALSVRVDSFSDTPLLIALITNLTAIYLKQRMTDKLPQTLEKASALLLCLPSHTYTSSDEVELLKLLLRRSVVIGDKHLEARVCYLISSLFLLLRKPDDALPFVERLQFLTVTFSASMGHQIAPLDLNWLLSCLYHRKYMPYLALASLSLDSRQDHSLRDAFQKIELFIRNSVRLNPFWKEGTSLLPAQIVVYLLQALAIAEQGEDLKTQRDLCLGLATVYQQYDALDKAVRCAQQAVETGGHINEEESFKASVLLGWLLVLTGQAEKAQSILQPLLISLQGTDSSTQRGVIHNLLALCLRQQGCIPEAGWHLHSALVISRESLHLFLELWESPTDEEHVQTYLWLGRSYKDRGKSQDFRACYEMGLLIALHARNLHSQMVVAKVLSRLYADVLLYGQSIVYYEHCVTVSRELKDKRLEGEYLEILSSLYLSLNTEKSSRKSLDYTKQSLRISIDLGKREEESETWLQVGRIYFLIHEDELADMYLQAAVKTALRMNDPHFSMSIYEEAGDVYFKSHRNRMASLPFYRDGSLPFARSIKDIHSEFRLLSKLTELLMAHREQEEALQYATLAVQIASKTGVRLNERTAYHRLASVYYNLQQYEMAENYYIKSVSFCPLVVQHPLEARYYTQLYCRLGNLTLHKLKDAFDAVGYFHLALAAALQDTANPEALYVVYMKLAEIHGNHMLDAQLCQVYRDRAQSLKRVLARGGSSAIGEESMDNADAAFRQKEDTVSENIFTSAAGKENCIIRVDAEKSHTDLIPDRKEDDGVHLSGPANPLKVPNESGTETIAGQSNSDATFTESFEMAKEQISDSSSLSDTRNYQSKTGGSNSIESLLHYVTNQCALAQMPAKNETSDITEETDVDLKKDSHACKYVALTDNAQ
ncbi:unnamed protein product [Lampetra planeri]